MIYPTYELDGQIKDEDYVYGSFVQSKMYHYNVSCKDCHDVERAFYNYALKLQEVNKNRKSIDVIDLAISSGAESEELLYVKLLGLINL